MSSPYDGLWALHPQDPWLRAICAAATRKLESHPHGDLPRWRAALASLPVTRPAAQLDSLVPTLGEPVGNPEALRQNLMAFHPWRKGPWRIGGIEIDTEWRSDWKWQRVAPHVNLKGQRVLDIGSGNGYFGMQMLAAGAQFVAGIDPTLVFVMQWLACRHFSGDLPNYVLPLGIEELPDTPGVTDCVFSMGVLYHRKSPVEHLEQIHSLLVAGGTMVLETLVLPQGSEEDLLVPGERYARMRNVWAIPGTSRLKEWVNVAGFSSAEVVDITPTTPQEQRSTDWMQFESLQQALDPGDCLRTVEGLPAPIRAIVVARK